MHYEFNQNGSYGRNIALITAITIISSAVSCIIGELFLPVAIAFLAMLFSFENSKRTVSIITAALIALIGIGLSVAYGVVNFIGVEIIASSAVIAFYFRSLKSKGELGFILTLLISVMTLLSLYFSAAAQVGSLAPAEVGKFYADMFSQLKSTLVDSFLSIKIQGQNGAEEALISKEAAVDMVDELFSMLLSVVIVIAFAITGLSLKIFGYAVGKYSKEPAKVYNWKFGVTTPVAYFFCALALITKLSSSLDSVFIIAMNNIYNIFMFVFAYLGFTFVFYILAHRRSTAFALFLTCGAVLFLNILAIEILSFVGVFYSIVISRVMGGGIDGDHDTDKKD